MGSLVTLRMAWVNFKLFLHSQRQAREICEEILIQERSNAKYRVPIAIDERIKVQGAFTLTQANRQLSRSTLSWARSRLNLEYKKTLTRSPSV